MTLLQLALGFGLTLAGWLAVRRVARTRYAGLGLAALDAMAPFAWFAALAGTTARPVFAGVVSFATFGGLAFADYFKRETLREPVVFCDSMELIEVARHPELYLPFAGPKRVMAGAAAAAAAFVGLLVLEPVAWPWTAATALASAAAIPALALLFMGPLSQTLYRWFAPLPTRDDPAADSAAFGVMATFLIYGARARAERERRISEAVAATRLIPAPAPASGHVVLIQAESFVDPRRWPGVDAALPGLDAARAAGPLHGRFIAPAWGANTVRTEFEVLTGVPDEALGYDRFNPYYAFVRRPLPSLAWALKARGYRTVCVHPYAGAFYGRRGVLPRLGFDAFHDVSAFKGAPRRRGFVTDAAVAAYAETLLAESQVPIFLFLITMENHGPWEPAPSGQASARDVYVEGARAADGLLERMARATGADRGKGLVALYGDHSPTLAEAGDDARTDYAIMRAGAQAQAQDLPASRLAEVILSLLPA